MIPGWEQQRVVRDGVGLAFWQNGSGPAVLLLHGYPESSYMWRGVAPALSATHTVVALDLRGYGRSDAPPPDASDRRYCKREMAGDAAFVLDSLGIRKADVVGHDRGGRVAHRLCLDHPDRVRSVAVLDIVPTLHMFETVDRAMAEAYFHWFFLTRPGGLPESLIRADSQRWLHSRFAGRHTAGFAFEERVIREYLAAFQRPGVIAATCSDYRAAASVDLEHDRADRAAGRLVVQPLLALWGTAGYVGRHFDVADVWRGYANDVRGVALPTDHYLAEESPVRTVQALKGFWSDR